MAWKKTDDTYYGEIAAAIRSKNGTQNTYMPSQMANAIDALPEIVDENAALVLIDWEGTLLRSYTRDEVMALTALPNPSTLPNYAYADHEWLVFQEWNWDLADIKDYFQYRPYGNLLVGAIYTTSDGQDHEYYYESDAGQNNSTLLCVKKGTSLKYAEHQDAYSLRFLSIPKDAVVSQFAYRGCSSLEHVNVPKNVIDIPNNFTACTSLKTISLPRTMSNIRLSSHYAMKNVYVSNSVQNFTIASCRALRKFLIPKGITSIGQWAYQENYSALHIVIESTPTLVNTNAFQRGNALRKFYVPSANLSFFETETNWAALYSSTTFETIEGNIDLLERLGFDVHEYKEVI